MSSQAIIKLDMSRHSDFWRARRSWDRMLVGARFIAPVILALEPTRPPVQWVTSSGVKRPGRGINHWLPSSAEIEERVELYLTSVSWRSWRVIGLRLPFLLYKIRLWDKTVYLLYTGDVQHFIQMSLPCVEGIEDDRLNLRFEIHDSSHDEFCFLGCDGN